jgi:hypothetical protein
MVLIWLACVGLVRMVGMSMFSCCLRKFMSGISSWFPQLILCASRSQFSTWLVLTTSLVSQTHLVGFLVRFLKVRLWTKAPHFVRISA